MAVINRVEEVDVANGNKTIYERKMERGLQEFVSTGQVVIFLSCQLVLAMFLCENGNGNIWEDAESGNR